MKHINKLNIIIILVFAISIIFSSNVQAIGSIFSDADAFLDNPNGAAISDTIDEGQLKETSNFMYKLLMAVGIVVMFIVGTIIGIQYMVASAEDKAKVKESLVPYIIGCFVIFGAFTIWSIAVNIGQDVVPSQATSTNGGGTTSQKGDGTTLPKEGSTAGTTSPNRVIGGGTF